MDADAWITLAVVGAVLVGLIREAAPPGVTLLGGVVVLLLVGVVPAEVALGGFANPATITIAALYVVARAVRLSGVADGLVARAMGGARSERGTLARLVPPVALLSSFVNNTPLVATAAPLVRDWADRHRRASSRYLMPLSFAAILGGMVTTIGTSTTLVVSGLMEERTGEAFGLFEVSPVGLPLALLGGAALIVLAPRLVPDRVSPSQRVVSHQRDYTFPMRVQESGPLDGLTVEEADLRHLSGVFLAGVDRSGSALSHAAPTDVLHGGDVLLFVGQVDDVRDLRARDGLVSTEDEHVAVLDTRLGGRLFEAVVGSGSQLAGHTLAETEFRAHYGAAVLAVHRSGQRVQNKLGQVPLRVGDVLLVLSDVGFAERWSDSGDFVVVADLGAHHAARPRHVPLTLLTVAGMLAVTASGLMPILHAVLAAVGVLLVSRTITVAEARDAVDLDIVLIVAGAIGLGTAVEVSGLAGEVAAPLVAASGDSGTVVALVLVLVVTLLMTELLSNVAAAGLMLPIALDVAAQVGADPRGFAVGVAVMASASFLTPIGYQTNTIVYGLGGYRYTDYWPLGLPLTLVAVSTTVVAVTLVW